MKTGKHAVIVFAAIWIFSLIGQASAFRLQDNLYFTVANDSASSVDIILPEDAGVRTAGAFDYVLESTSLWDDLSVQTVRTDENNTVIIPINFFGGGRPEGSCENHTITISVPALSVVKTFQGGVCVSDRPDVDVVDSSAVSAAGGDAGTILNTNVDMFSVGFQMPSMEASAGETLTYTLFAESQAAVTLDLEDQSTGLALNPSQASVTLGSVPFQLLNFSVQAPAQPGSYNIKIKATARNCTGSFCTKTAEGTLTAGQPAPQAGFDVTLFPGDLSIRDPNPVDYRLSIKNNGLPASFSITATMSSGLSSNFQDRQVQMETGELKEFAFTATPSIQQGGGLFQLRITVSAGDATKYVTSVITTGEMLTDPARSAAWITANTTNQSIISSVNSALNAWNTDNSQSPYGTNTQGYQDLNNALANARLNANQPGNPPGTQTCTPQVKECGGGMLFECNSSGTGWVSSLCDFGCSNDTLACKAEGPGNGDVTILLVALGIVAAVAVVLVLAFFMRGRKGSIEKQLNESWEN